MKLIDQYSFSHLSHLTQGSSTRQESIALCPNALAMCQSLSLRASLLTTLLTLRNPNLINRNLRPILSLFHNAVTQYLSNGSGSSTLQIKCVRDTDPRKLSWGFPPRYLSLRAPGIHNSPSEVWSFSSCG